MNAHNVDPSIEYIQARIRSDQRVLSDLAAYKQLLVHVSAGQHSIESKNKIIMDLQKKLEGFESTCIHLQNEKIELKNKIKSQEECYDDLRESCTDLQDEIISLKEKLALVQKVINN
jgi:chromosome segregation ATPase